MSLTDALSGDVAPLWEVASWAANLPPRSAVDRSANPNWEQTWELELQRRIDQSLRVLAWQNSGGKGTAPEPFEFPWDEPPQGTWRGDPLDWDKAADLLGGDERLARLLSA